MKNKLILFVLALLSGQSFLAQNPLPVLKASSKLIHIRDGLHFKKGHWYMTPSDNPDYYYVEIPTKEHRVTFISDIDSISFDVKYGREYDFIILVNNEESFQRRISATYKNLDDFIRKKGKPGPDTLSFSLGDNDKVYLKGIVNGSQPLDIQFDLGSGGTLIKKGSLEKVNMKFDQSITLRNSDGINQVPMASQNRLEMGDMVWDSISIAVADNMTYREDLILGNSLFKNKILEIDYNKKILIVHDSLPAFDASYSQHDIILDGGIVPFIEGSLTFRNEKQKGWMMVDLGAYTSILNSEDVPSSNKMLEEAKRMIGLNDREFSPALQIGKHEFSGFNYTVQKLDRDAFMMILGNDLLKRFNLLLDNQNGFIYLKPNSLVQEPYRNPEYLVVRVATGALILIFLVLVYLRKRKIYTNRKQGTGKKLS